MELVPSSLPSGWTITHSSNAGYVIEIQDFVGSRNETLLNATRFRERWHIFFLANSERKTAITHPPDYLTDEVLGSSRVEWNALVFVDNDDLGDFLCFVAVEQASAAFLHDLGAEDWSPP